MGRTTEGPPLEATILRACIRVAQEMGAWVHRVHSGGWARVGVPDLVLCHHGRFVAVEVKRPRLGALSPIQRLTMGKIAAAGGVAIVATSAEELKDCLAALSAGTPPAGSGPPPACRGETR